MEVNSEGRNFSVNRIAGVDFAKGFVMILVVFGHVIELYSDLDKFIFIFHMPFFFIMAGFLLNLNKWERDYKNFSSKLLKRLLLPYYLANFLWYPIWFIVCHEMGFLKYLWNWPSEDPFRCFLAIFVGNAMPGDGLTLGPMWFLPCLFVAEIIFIRFYNRFNKIGENVFVLAIATCSLLGIFIGKIHSLPLGTDIALSTQIFLLIGVLVRRHNFIERMDLKIFYGLIFVLIGAFCLNTFVDMNFRRYGEPFLFFSGGIAGTLLVMKLSILMPGGKFFSLISYCGRQSVMILVLHPIIANIFYEVVARNTNFPPENFLTEPIIIFGATVTGVLIPLIIAKRFGRLPVIKYFCA